MTIQTAQVAPTKQMFVVNYFDVPRLCFTLVEAQQCRDECRAELQGWVDENPNNAYRKDRLTTYDGTIYEFDLQYKVVE